MWSTDEALTMNVLEESMREIVAASIDIDVDEVALDLRLVADLDADSLDVLDISYRVSRKFGVTLPLSDLKKQFEESDVVWLDEQGQVTERGYHEVVSVIPEIEGRIKPGDRIEGVFMVLTVADLVAMLARRLEVVS